MIDKDEMKKAERTLRKVDKHRNLAVFHLRKMDELTKKAEKLMEEE